MTPPVTLTVPPGYNRVVRHPALSAITRTGTKAARLRVELACAEREHNDAILAAVALTNPDAPSQPLLSVQQIAAAAGTTRAPIYKRIQRAKQGGSYGQRPEAAA